MISQVTFNKDKWIAAMMLDPITGLDPPDVKIRAAEGISAASSFMQGYWIWCVILRMMVRNASIEKLRVRSKIVENLAVVGYDTNNLYLAPYDWRLSYSNLEERDGYFSRLKTNIESLKYAPISLVSSCVINFSFLQKRKRQKKKVVLAAHSMGATVYLPFVSYSHCLYIYRCYWCASPEFLIMRDTADLACMFH
jgi:phospholipid:diacylglycerol acyltransferase